MEEEVILKCDFCGEAQTCSNEAVLKLVKKQWDKIHKDCEKKKLLEEEGGW